MSGTCPSFPSKICWGQVSLLGVPHPWEKMWWTGSSWITLGASEKGGPWFWVECPCRRSDQRVQFWDYGKRGASLHWSRESILIREKLEGKSLWPERTFLFAEPLCCKPCLSDGKRNQRVPKHDPESQTSTPHFANSADWDRLSGKSRHLTLLNHKR